MSSSRDRRLVRLAWVLAACLIALQLVAAVLTGFRRSLSMLPYAVSPLVATAGFAAVAARHGRRPPE